MNGAVSKTVKDASLSRVRIPPSPLISKYRQRAVFCFYRVSVRGPCEDRLITGSLVTQLKWKQTDSHWPDYQVYKGFVLEPPEIKAKTVSCLLETQRRKVLLHIVRDSASLSLKTGDEMLYCAKIRRPKNAGNPYEFDYAEWLLRQRVRDYCFTHLPSADC